MMNRRPDNRFRDDCFRRHGRRLTSKVTQDDTQTDFADGHDNQPIRGGSPALIDGGRSPSCALRREFVEDKRSYADRAASGPRAHTAGRGTSGEVRTWRCRYRRRRSCLVLRSHRKSGTDDRAEAIDCNL